MKPPPMPFCGALGERDSVTVQCPFPYEHDGPHSWERPLPAPWEHPIDPVTVAPPGLVPPPTMAEPATGDATLLDLLNDTADDARGAGEGRYATALRQLEAVCRYVDRLHALVRWFDLAYGANEPTWLFENVYGQPLPANVEHYETYRGVIGDKQPHRA